MKKDETTQLGQRLRDRGLKATPGRLAILQILKTTGQPLSIARVAKRLSGRLDPATVYRALEALVHAGLVRRIDFQHSHTYYELIEPDNHHHHLVCETCGKVEDVAPHEPEDLEQTVLQHSRNFTEIRSHSLEFFGICRSCVK